MKNLLLFIFTLLVLGCASSPELLLNQSPVEVTNETINEYWVQENKTFSFRLPLKHAPKQNAEGYVVFRYLIDSNGNTFNPEIIESVPKGIWDYAGVKALSKQNFVAVESNTAKTPVYYTQTIFFK